MMRLAAVAIAVVMLSACTPPVGDDDWRLEPIAFRNSSTGQPGDAYFGDTPFAGGGARIDVAVGMSLLAADGVGGFWASSSGSWLHVGANGETLARFTTQPGEPLSRIDAMVPLSVTEFLVVHDEHEPVLAVLDTTTMSMRDVPGGALSGPGEYGEYVLADIATHDGDAIVVRYQPHPPEQIDYELLRIDLTDGRWTSLRSATMTLPATSAGEGGMPQIEVDADATGRVFLATPSARIVLGPDGAERSSTSQSADSPGVAVRPDGTALWWGGEPEESSRKGVIVGGSAEARQSIERRENCTVSPRADALRLSDDSGEHPLPFLCAPNAAVWTGSSWVLAIGGEGDGVLVRLTPPAPSD